MTVVPVGDEVLDSIGASLGYGKLGDAAVVVVVVGADGVSRGTAKTGHTRGLATVFGPVTVRRTT